MPDFQDHNEIIALLESAQEADHDNREQAREAHLFLDKRDGQWEPFWWNANSGKPRYTFDLSNPIVDQIAGEMEQADFDIKVKPAGGDATKDIAMTFDGLIRNIENISNATSVFGSAGRSMVAAGVDGWRVVQKFVDSDSFDQDLVIEKISNFVDRVWFDPSAEMQDASDAKYCFVLQGVSKDEYEEKWPDGGKQGVSEDREASAYFNKPDLIMVGEFYYIKEVERTLVLMSNGAVYEDDEDFQAVADDLALLQVTEVKRRNRPKNVVFVRKFDAGDWLEDEKETVFSFIPVIPTYANFKINENKIIYWGAVEKIIDAQRVLNYSMSREIEEGALAPRAKYWMTEKQASGHERELGTLNTNSDPVQLFNPDAESPGIPQQNGGAAINPGLQGISQAMTAMISQSAGLFAANMGDNPGLQSGVAIEKLQNKGDTGTIKYFKAQEVAICHTARILVNAIPKVYESERQVRVLKEDGSFDMTVLNERVIDQETQEVVTLNDLSMGMYDVTCSSGPAFQNRQQETVSAMTEIAQLDPSILQTGGDILLNNITAPGMEQLAERKRQQLFQAGAIPQEQMTEEELQLVQQQAQQPQEPSPEMLIGQAELIKAQNEEKKTDIDVQVKSAQLQLDQQKLQLEAGKLQLQQQQHQDKTELEIAKVKEMQGNADFTQFMEQQKLQMEQNAAILEGMNKQANTLKTLREAMGVDAIVGPHNQEAYINQAVAITESQESAGVDTSIGEDVTGS